MNRLMKACWCNIYIVFNHYQTFAGDGKIKYVSRIHASVHEYCKGLMNDLYVTSMVAYKLLIRIRIIYPSATTANTKTLQNHIHVMYIRV